MKISYKWLQKFINLDKTPEEIAEKLTACSFEVEEIIKQGEGLDKVVVGEVMEKEKHPDADRLNLVKVKISDSEILDIVCGAPNIEAGQKVAVALVGAKIPCGLEIAERKVRGEKSCGMVCAEDELGLGSDHEGIMVLDDSLKIGTPIKEALGLDDVIFDIDILPNRAHDCLNHYGVAREIAALFDLQFDKKDLNISTEAKNKNEFLEIKTEEKEACPRYSAAVVQGVEVKDSSEEIKQLLKSCELRSINNIVDITNYIMFAFGQPMHAFDADKIEGGIVIRYAKSGEKILALDDEEYELNSEDLLICDSRGPIAIAGVIGGKDSAVTEKTKNIVFESANFEGIGVRKTAQRLKISTDASYRFERSIDPEMTIFCLKEAIKIAEDSAKGELSGEVLDIYNTVSERRKIVLEFSRIENLLGKKIDKEEVVSILKKLDFEVLEKGENLEIIIPTYRLDVDKINDIIEEIGRIYGYEKIISQKAEVVMQEINQSEVWNLSYKIKNIFESLGFFETYNRSFVSEKELVDLGLDKALELKNYLSEDEKLMRNSLLPGFLKNTVINTKNFDSFQIFELGKVFSSCGEHRILGGVIYDKSPKDEIFYIGKGLLDVFFEKIGIQNIEYQKISEKTSYYHGGKSADLLLDGNKFGTLGEIHPEVLGKYDLRGRLLYFEIKFEELLKKYEDGYNFKSINKLPASEFDISAVFAKSTQWSEIEKAVEGIGNKNIVKIYPFDEYEGEKLGEDKKSIAFRVVLQSKEKTLEDNEIKSILNAVIKAVEKIGGEVRK